ncbi:hypothetical protein H8959_001702 [Pygathrix nigripes]
MILTHAGLKTIDLDVVGHLYLTPFLTSPKVKFQELKDGPWQTLELMPPLTYVDSSHVQVFVAV